VVSDQDVAFLFSFAVFRHCRELMIV
jgi:hypothetical protein